MELLVYKKNLIYLYRYAIKPWAFSRLKGFNRLRKFFLCNLAFALIFLYICSFSIFYIIWKEFLTIILIQWERMKRKREHLYNVISNFWWLQHGRYLFGWIGLWAPYAFSVKFLKKSDTVVALRRSLSLIMWITLVSFINVYYAYFCKITGCFGIKTLLHVTRQCKLRFWDINMHIIEKNIHVLCNVMSYECHLMKIIKG
jgi:hypothetical protein